MTAIEFNNISKQYRLGLVSTNTLSHDLKRWYAMNIQGKDDPYLKIGEVNDRAHRGESEYVWALKDINFKVEQGDVLGIIGKNGAGKSTLLKILSKVTAPTTGTIKARGRIASLLEVGTGFHPEMTGRENIYLNGAILGMTKAEINRKLDEIVDFSGVERYIDTPVKRYSSGMMVRLGFAVAAHLDPEILVVDEVLAVGDAEFQKKAIGKMQDISKGGQGRTVLFVSHNMAAVGDLCKKAIILSNGSVSNTGNVKEIIDIYMSSVNNIELSRTWSDMNYAPGNDIIRLKKVCSVDFQCKQVQYSLTSEKIGIYIEYEVLKNTSYFTHGINVYTTSDLHLLSSHDNNVYQNDSIVEKGEYKTVVWIPSNLLQSGDYLVSFAFMRYNPFNVLLTTDNLLRIQIVDTMKSSSRPENVNEYIPGLIRPKLFWDERIIIN